MHPSECTQVNAPKLMNPSECTQVNAPKWMHPTECTHLKWMWPRKCDHMNAKMCYLMKEMSYHISNRKYFLQKLFGLAHGWRKFHKELTICSNFVNFLQLKTCFKIKSFLQWSCLFGSLTYVWRKCHTKLIILPSSAQAPAAAGLSEALFSLSTHRGK